MESVRYSRWARPAAYAFCTLGLLTPALAQTSSGSAPAARKQVDQKRKALKPVPKEQPGRAVTAGPSKPSPTPVQLKPEPSQPDWTKVCGKDPKAQAEICYTTRDFVTEQGHSVLSVAVYDVKASKPQRIVRFLMPLGLLLQPGIRFSFDQGSITSGRYGICVPKGCFAEATVKDEFVGRMKSGATLNVSAQNPSGQVVTLAVPTTGFQKAYDGEPIDPQALAQQQKSLLEALEKRSNELRRRLQQESGTSKPATTADAAADRAGE